VRRCLSERGLRVDRARLGGVTSSMWCRSFVSALLTGFTRRAQATLWARRCPRDGTRLILEAGLRVERARAERLRIRVHAIARCA